MGLGKLVKGIGKAITPFNPLIAAGASLIGGAMARKGQQQTNAQQEALAQKQMDFQERMSSTAYQRSAADLEKAGLNRVLALGSPSSSPSGAMAQLRNPEAAMGEAVSKAPTSALNAKQMTAMTQNIKQQTETEKQRTDAQWALVQSYQEQAGQYSAYAQKLNLENIQNRILTEMYVDQPELLMLRDMGNPASAAVGAASRALGIKIPGLSGGKFGPNSKSLRGRVKELTK